MLSNPKIRIISGGQTGVDTGALAAAKTLGLARLAIFPKGFKREEKIDKQEAWLKEFAEELGSTDYAARTRYCINKAFAVLVIASPEDSSTPGTELTKSLAVERGRQLWVFQNVRDKAKWKAECHAIAYWLRSLLCVNPGFDLMVAGPRTGKWTEAEQIAFALVTATMQAIRGDA